MGYIPQHSLLLQLQNFIVVHMKVAKEDVLSNVNSKFLPDDRAFHPSLKNSYLSMTLQAEATLERLAFDGTIDGSVNFCWALLNAVFGVEPPPDDDLYELLRLEKFETVK